MTPKSFRLLLENLSHLRTLDLHRLLWQLVAMEKSIRGISAVALSAHPSVEVLMPKRIAHAGINEHEFRIYSQNGEDGILLWLFSKIGTTSKRFVEFGMGSGRECITTNLILTFGWRGLLMDGSTENVHDAKLFFKQLLHWEEFAQLDIRKEFVTKENINSLLQARMHPEELDLLVIDIDGNDFWIWEAITVVSPRIVVIEYNATFGPEKSVTIPYKADFDAYAEHPFGIYHGVSLAASVKLATEKGYIFVGCESNGTNAFFVKSGLADELRTTPDVAFYENHHQAKRGTQPERWNMVQDRVFETV